MKGDGLVAAADSGLGLGPGMAVGGSPLGLVGAGWSVAAMVAGEEEREQWTLAF